MDYTGEANTYAPLSRLSAVDALALAGDVIPILKVHQLLVLRTDGHWYFQSPGLPQVMAMAADVETLLKQHGLAVPPNVDKVIALLPVLLPLLGR